MLGLAACREGRLHLATGARREVDGPIVRNIAFEGNGGILSGHSDYQLRAAMEQLESPAGVLTPGLNALVTPQELDSRALERDAYRLEVFYAHRGWFDARIEGWELRVRRRELPERQKAAVVDLRGHVDPGPASMFRDLAITGVHPGIRGHIGGLRRRAGIAPERQFDLDTVIAFRDRIERTLHENSYAHARVGYRMDAYPEERAVDVVVDVDSGPSAVYGSVHIEGNERVRTRYVEQELRIREGQPYRLSDFHDARRRLFALGTFSLVSVEPELTEERAAEVPVTVRLAESPRHAVDTGAGVTFDGLAATPRLSVGFTRFNAFRRLVRIEASGSGGYAFPLTGGNVLRMGLPTYSGRIGFNHPRIFGGPAFGLVAEISIEQALQGGYFPYRNPEGRIGLAWRATDRLSVRLAPHFEQYRLLDTAGSSRIIAETFFGEGFTNPYQLLTLDADVTYDRRVEPLDARNGYFFQIGARQAVRTVVGDYAYTELNGDFRRYVPIPRRPFTLALRAQGRLLQAWRGGDLDATSGAIPYPERVFLGGSSDLRGFRLDGFGPYDCLCLYSPAGAGDPFTGAPGAGRQVDRRYLPVGGRFGGTGTVELRRHGEGLTWAVYADAGLLGNRTGDLGLQSIAVGGGAGIRYASPIGPIRFDVAARPVYPAFDRDARTYVNCFAEDRMPRTWDLVSGVQRIARSPAGWRAQDWSQPVAINIYLAIGQAF